MRELHHIKQNPAQHRLPTQHYHVSAGQWWWRWGGGEFILNTSRLDTFPDCANANATTASCMQPGRWIVKLENDMARSPPALCWAVHPASSSEMCGSQQPARRLCETKDPFFFFSSTHPVIHVTRGDKLTGLVAQIGIVFSPPLPSRRAYPLRLKRTGQEVKASPQTADSSGASPPLRLSTWSSNTSPLLRHPSSAAGTRRARRLRPLLWGDLSAAHSSDREPYPVDKLLKFRS